MTDDETQIIDNKRPKKVITNKAIKDMIKRMSQIKHKSTSHINANGELIRSKYDKFSHDSEGVNEATPEIRTLPGDEYYGNRIRRDMKTVSDIYDEGDDVLIPRKKSKVRKNKKVKRKCRCV